MAKLTKLGEFEGPGEEKTAFYLEKHLPSDWHVIHGRQLPDKSRTEIDFLILGKNFLFVVEEKNWGPEIAVGEIDWYVIHGIKYDQRKAPTLQASQAAKKAKGYLESKIGSKLPYMSLQDTVILSQDNVIVRVNPGQANDPNVIKLNGCEEYFLAIDKNENSAFAALREKIEATILGLPEKNLELSHIGDYSVLGEVEEPFAGVRTFQAENTQSGEEVLLTCYDHTYWKSDANGRSIISRERNVEASLEDLGCVWKILPEFFFERKQWQVVPSQKPNRYLSLLEMASEESKESFDENAEKYLLAALNSLEQIHEEGVIHKNINPETIWVGPKGRVRFNQLRLAHLDGLATLNLGTTDKRSQKHFAPEVADPDYFSSYQSDSYSLASSFAFCLFGESGLSSTVPEKHSRIADVLSKMMAENANLRINVSQAINDLKNTLVEEPSLPSDASIPHEFVEGGVINERYEIVKFLGEGGMGVSWLAKDRIDGGRLRVLKALRRIEDYELAVHEYSATATLKGLKFCSTPTASDNKPAPGFLVYDYVSGRTLDEISKTDEFDLSRAKSFFLDALRKLGEVHDRGMLHGDLSPSNLLIDEQEDLWLIDFGLAVEIGKTRFGGTPATMAPEIPRKDALIKQSDIYSLCASFVFALLNRPPYKGDRTNLSSRDWSIRQLGELEKQQLGDEASSFLNLLLKNCDPDPKARAESAEALYLEFEAAQSPKVNQWPEQDAVKLVNSTVNRLRKFHIQSKDGASNSIGKDDIYVDTLLDRVLIPDVLSGEARLVFLTGNAGDGKTSFLQTLQASLVSNKAELVENDRYGWSYKYGSRTIIAVNDASESKLGESRDERTRRVLDRYLNFQETVLLAINDGRMQEFFDEHMLDYPEISSAVQDYFERNISETGDIKIVDLKSRSLVSGDGLSILDSVIDAVTAEPLWKACHDCAVVRQCPIFSNANMLSGTARPSVKEIFEITHLRRKKRITLRQMRSTISWLITGDLSCQDVHELPEKKGQIRKEWALPELAFSRKTNDLLIQEWRELDPAKLNSSRMSKFLESQDSLDFGFSTQEIYARSMRAAYFKQSFGDGVEFEEAISEDTKSYKFFQEFSNYMQEPSTSDKGLLLRGISRLISSIFYLESDLVISKRSAGKWIPLRKFPADGFKLEAVFQQSGYLETQNEGLILTHIESTKKLFINLDVFEVILRAAEGQLMADPASDAIRHEVQRFTNNLIGQPIEQIYVVEPSGRQNLVQVAEGVISLVDGGLYND